MPFRTSRHLLPTHDPSSHRGRTEWTPSELNQWRSAAAADRDVAPAGERQWVRFDASGRGEYVAADKQFADDLDLPSRDVLMINPLVPTPFPPSILIRGRALVVNLGAVRAVIAADEVYLLAVPAPRTGSVHGAAPAAGASTASRWAFPRLDGGFEAALADRLAGRVRGGGPGGGSPRGSASGGSPTSPRAPASTLPYELRALEACLEAALAWLASDADELAASLPSTLDALGQAATAASLAAARGTKVAIKRLAARVDAVKRELNEIMDDDQDMEDMYLSRKLEAEAAAAASPVADTAASLIRTASRASSVLTLPDGRLDISACENLLESYFMRADYLSSRLDGLRERLDDQEALVAIALDNRRNEIISLNLVATLLTAGLALVSAVAGLLGMNLAPLPVETSTVPFVAIVAASCVAGAAVFLGGMAFARRRALLWNPSEFPSVPRDG